MPSRLSPSVEPPALVLVTGANGFIASHVIAQLLDAGYNVIGTVRSTEKATIVNNTHNNHPSLQTCVVSTIISSEQYIQAINTILSPGQQLSAIIHLAAPFFYSVTDYEKDLLIPAVQGTEAILEVAKHFQVKLVVHTNSFASIYDASAGPYPEKTYTAEDWSPLTYQDGVNAPNAPTAYRAAKTVAEKTAWQYMEKYAGELSFGLVSLCPAMVFGAFLENARPESISGINESNKLVWDVIRQGGSGSIPPTKAPVWVDVRDVATAHVRALRNPGVVGKRLLLAAGVYCNQEIADEAREACPKLKAQIPVGEPGRREAESHFKVDTRKEAELLEMSWTPLGETLKDLVPQLFQIADGGK